MFGRSRAEPWHSVVLLLVAFLTRNSQFSRSWGCFGADRWGRVLCCTADLPAWEQTPRGRTVAVAFTGYQERVGKRDKLSKNFTFHQASRTASPSLRGNVAANPQTLPGFGPKRSPAAAGSTRFSSCKPFARSRAKRRLRGTGAALRPGALGWGCTPRVWAGRRVRRERLEPRGGMYRRGERVGNTWKRGRCSDTVRVSHGCDSRARLSFPPPQTPAFPQVGTRAP